MCKLLLLHNVDIDKKVIVEEQPGFETQDKHRGPFVLKLRKSLYGLAQKKTRELVF